MRVCSLLLLLIPCIFFSCSQNNVTEDPSLQKYFDSAGVKGCFGLYDNGQGHFLIYNLERYRDSSYQPGATFDLILSLVAIQTGAAKDGEELGRIGFDSVARRIGYDTLKKWVDSLSYGNRNIGDKANFGANYDLRVRPDEELGLIKKLYFNQLPFFEHVQVSVRALMQQESNANYQMFYKKAQERTADGHAIGWVLGWVEENKHPYFFVVNLEAADPNADLAGAGLRILKGILAEKGFFQGKK
jgi:beta-lactamase class D